MKKRDLYISLAIVVAALFLYLLLSLPQVNELVYNESLGVQVEDGVEKLALAPGDENWTIIHFPDSQNSVSEDGAAMLSQTEWIRDNVLTEDIKFTIHVGDIVSSSTNLLQWDRADLAFDILDANSIPYTVLPGNHDGHSQGNDPEDWTNYNLYFGPQRFVNMPEYGDKSVNPAIPGEMTPGDNSNNFALFSVNGIDYIVVNIEVWPDSSEIAWANERLQEYSDRKAIFVTHGLLYGVSPDVNYGSGFENMRYIFDDLISNNDNVITALSGHAASDWRVDYTDTERGMPVQSLNYGGRDGWLGLIKMDSIGDRMYVTTYSPYLNEFKTSEADEYYVPLFFDLGDNSPTSCVLSNAQWSASSSQVGEELEMSVSGTGCQGHDIQFDIFDSSGEIVKDTQGQLHGEVRFVQMENGEAQYGWTPRTAGDYTFVARVANHQSLSASSSSLQVTGPSMCADPGSLGIVGYWKLDETGNTIVDYAYRRDGEVNGNPASVPGKLGNALSFVENVVDDVRIDHHSSLTEFDEMSVSVWIKKTSSTGTTEAIVSKGPTGGDKGAYMLRYEPDNGGELSWGVYDSSVAFRSAVNSVNILDGQWHHIVGTYDGDKVVAYLDGTKLPVVESGVAGPVYDNNKGPVVIGRLSHKSDFTRQEFVGSVDEVVIYNRAISGSEVQNLYNSGSGTDACSLQAPQCGDGDDVCIQGETQACVTSEGYDGLETCNSICTGFDASTCTSQEFCGDGTVNGLEACELNSQCGVDEACSSCQCVTTLECELTSVYWDKTSATENDFIYGVVEFSDDVLCKDLKVDLNLWESDSQGDDFVRALSSIWLRGDERGQYDKTPMIERFRWYAEHLDDVDGMDLEPEFLIEATLVETGQKMFSSNKIEVTKNNQIQESENLIYPSDLVYMGAFKVPSDTTGGQGSRWGYGGWGLTFSPDGDPANNDNYPGSLYGIGHDSYDDASEISIPTPVISPTKNTGELNRAVTLQEFGDITGGFEPLEKRDLGGLAYLEAQGLQTTPKIYWTIYEDYNANGDNHFTHGWSELDISNPQSVGMWQLGSGSEQYHSKKTADYVFDIDRQWADDNLGGRYLASGRSRAPIWGFASKAPSMYVFSPWNDGNPPAGDSFIDSIELMVEPAQENVEGFSYCDSWEGGAWLTKGGRNAAVFAGRKGIGEDNYGEPRTGDCSGGKGYHCDPYEAQILFYNPADLRDVADGIKSSVGLRPYAIFKPQQYFWDTCGKSLGGLAFDRQNGYLYVMQRTHGESGPLMHVFQLSGGVCSDDSDCVDGYSCNGIESCDLQTNKCVVGTPVYCDDGISCTVDSCSEAIGGCESVPNDEGCVGGICDPISQEADANGCVPIVSVCGNGVKEGIEKCDDLDLGIETCQTQGFDSGNLLCVPSEQAGECTFDTSQCAINACTLTDVYWSVTGAIQGDSVSVTIEGLNCLVDGVDLELWENDGIILGKDYVKDLSQVQMQGDTVTFTWIVEYIEDEGFVIDIDPEFMIKAVLENGDELFSSNELSVSQQVGCIDDEDCDGVLDLSDVCPGTITIGVTDNGCPLPLAGEFDIISDLSGEDLSQVIDFTLGITDVAKVDFGLNSINMLRGNAGVYERVDLDVAIEISDKSVSIDSTLLPEFDKSANITFYGVDFASHLILRDGADCAECEVESYDSVLQELNVSVPGFSTYTVQDASFGGGGDDGGDDSSSSSSSGGGGSSGRSSSSSTTGTSTTTGTGTTSTSGTSSGRGTESTTDDDVVEDDEQAPEDETDSKGVFRAVAIMVLVLAIVAVLFAIMHHVRRKKKIHAIDIMAGAASKISGRR